MTYLNCTRNMAGTPLWMLPKAILRAHKSRKKNIYTCYKETTKKTVSQITNRNTKHFKGMGFDS